jgi:hypothetical protein
VRGKADNSKTAPAEGGRRVYEFSGERTVDAVVSFVQNGYASATSDVFPK